MSSGKGDALPLPAAFLGIVLVRPGECESPLLGVLWGNFVNIHTNIIISVHQEPYEYRYTYIHPLLPFPG